MEDKVDSGATEAVCEKTVVMPSTNARTFYRRYLALLQPMIKLRKREADVLAELMYFNYMKRDVVNDTDRFTLIFDISTRRKIGDYLGEHDKNTGELIKPLSNPVIQQALTGLRKKGLISGIRLKNFFLIEPQEGEFSLTFKFIVE
jgi:hypothetical protein